MAESIRALLSLAAPRQQATVRSAPAAPQSDRQTDRQAIVRLCCLCSCEPTRRVAARFASLLYSLFMQVWCT